MKGTLCALVALMLSSLAMLHAANRAPVGKSELDLGRMVQPIPMKAKFAEPGYFVWCGAPIRGVDGKYHLYYSRWPVSKGFAPGWALHSEIAYAVADQPLGPYRHVNVALAARGISPATGQKYWDGDVTHNPNILRHSNGKYYLFYMGNHGDGQSYPMHRNNQRIGVAVAERPEGPWRRFDRPIVDVSADKSAFDSLCVTNPAATERPDGGILLIYKAVQFIEGKAMGGNVRYGAALAEKPDGTYIKTPGRIFEAGGDDGKTWMLAEDPFIWFSRRYGNRYYAVARDVVGKFTGAAGGIALFKSADGLNWQPAAHPKVLGSRYPWADGSLSITQLERPALLFDGEEPLALFGAADGYLKAGRISCNVFVPLKPDPPDQRGAAVHERPAPSRFRPLLVPRIAGEWIHIYKPRGDVFPGADSKRFKAGQYYADWQPNDHAILKGPDERWHAFGITHPTVPPGESNPHEGEWLSFHAVSPRGPLKEHLAPGAWKDQEKLLPPAARPGEAREFYSPYIIRHAGEYVMVYAPNPIRYATSKDLWSWTPRGELFRQEGGARDPSIMKHGDLFYLSYTTKLSVMVRTSSDLVHWSEPTTVFSLAADETGGPESPTLLAMHGGYYLIFCRWDAKLTDLHYQNRSYVYYSDNPLDFRNREPVAEIQGHAPEFFQDEDGNWWISSAEQPFRGVSIAPVKWQARNAKTNDEFPYQPITKAKIPTARGVQLQEVASRATGISSLTASGGGPDAALLREKGTLIFQDSFDRQQADPRREDVGNGWETSTAQRAPGKVQATLDGGILKITRAPEANHSVHVHHNAGFRDGGVMVRFKLPGLNPQEQLHIGFVDRECKTVHAGHLCYAFIKSQGPSLTLIDRKSGSMNLENFKRYQEGVAGTGHPPADLLELYKRKQVIFPIKLGNDAWHELVLVIEGDEMRATLDGTPAGRLKSEGIAHPVKRWISLLAETTAWVDDIKIWRLR